MGSVKDLIVKKEATENESGIGVFQFSDDYSVFDYGKMADKIPDKGEALCRMAAYNFKELEKLGIKSHFRQLISGNEMEVDLVRVLRPGRDEITEQTTNYLVPLELIFRNSLPKGSSVFKRVEAGETTWEKLGLDIVPVPGTMLEAPIFDVSTKLERLDRYMGWGEAQELAKLTDSELQELKEKLNSINEFITKKAGQIGLEHADGKVEFGMNPERKLMLLDVVGTLDEDRMLYHGRHVSKQVLRDYYADNTDWGSEMEKVKKAGLPEEQWPKPPHLPKELIEIVSNMYKAVTEEWIGERIWNAPAIREVMGNYRDFMEGNKDK